MGIDTSIDEFFDEHLQRVLGAPAAAAERGSWYPAPSKAFVDATVDASERERTRIGEHKAAVER